MFNIASYIITNGVPSSLISVLSTTGYTLFKIAKNFTNSRNKNLTDLINELDLNRKIKIIEATIPLIKNKNLEPIKISIECINDTLNSIYQDLEKIKNSYNYFIDKKPKYIERVKKNSESLDRQFSDLLQLTNLAKN